MCIEKFDFPICNASHSHLPLQSSFPFTSPQPQSPICVWPSRVRFSYLTPLPVIPALADLTERSHPQCRYSRGFPTVLYRLLAGSRVVHPLFPFLDAGLKDLLRTCLGATVRGNPQGYWFFKLCTRKPELDFFRTSLRHSKSIKIISMREIIFPRYAEMV